MHDHSKEAKNSLTHKHDSEHLLKHHGLKLTPLRKSLLSILQNAQKPLSAEEIARKLKNVDYDRATLFRNLKTFVENHLCDAIDLGEGFQRFEIHQEAHHSHHIQCTNCKRIEEVHFCVPKEIEEALKKQGYSNISHRMDFFGICKKCS
ncbi:MAG: Fur family transcriptional regulator [Bacteriovoracaceae bacterium]